MIRNNHELLVILPALLPGYPLPYTWQTPFQGLRFHPQQVAFDCGVPEDHRSTPSQGRNIQCTWQSSSLQYLTPDRKV